MRRVYIREAISKVQISDLKELAEKEPTFIFMVGGAGAGKNFVFNKYLKGLKLIDIDEYTAEFGKEFNTDPRKQVSRATARSKKELLDAFKNKQTIVQMGTGNNIESSSNKFKWAKDAGMKVVVLLVDVEPETALKRNKERHAGGEQRLVPDDKVIRTVEVSKLNTVKYGKDENVESVIIYKN